MSIFSRLRLYHAAIGLLAVATYLTEDVERLHVWIGYGLAFIIVARLVFALIAPRVLSKPHWLINRHDLTLAKGLSSPIIGKGILVAIMACLLVTIGTGIAMDQKLTLNADSGVVVSTAFADEKRSDHKRDKPNKVVKEIHEVAANGLFLFVFLHVAYLLLIRRQYALAIIFLGGVARAPR
jgi:cytochrome b